MAQTGFTPIQLYSSSTATNVPLAANLATGELAINITDGKLFYKDNAAAVQVIGWKVVPATAGGTGQTSYAIGDLLYADTTTTLAKLPDVATGNALISGGIGVAPSWGKIGLTTHVSGTLPVANGGTGQSSTLTQYGIIYGSTTTAMASSAAGTSTQVLHGNASGAPTWSAVSLTADISGTLPVANGGTNLTSFTANGVVYASSTSALATGSALTFDGSALATTGTIYSGGNAGFAGAAIPVASGYQYGIGVGPNGLIGTRSAGNDYRLQIGTNSKLDGTYRSSSTQPTSVFTMDSGITTITVYPAGTAGNAYGAATATTTFSASGGLTIPGALSKGSGSFRIDHPLPQLEETHQLVHSFIEGPQADLIYRGKVNLINGQANINIDLASGMTEGTFEALCREVQCFTTNESGWNHVRGAVTGNILTIECQDQTASDLISWMVIGERKDKHMMDTGWTDDDGKVIVEPLKIVEQRLMNPSLDDVTTVEG
jgi:hypothetical protein